MTYRITTGSEPPLTKTDGASFAFAAVTEQQTVWGDSRSDLVDGLIDGHADSGDDDRLRLRYDVLDAARVLRQAAYAAKAAENGWDPATEGEEVLTQIFSKTPPFVTGSWDHPVMLVRLRTDYVPFTEVLLPVGNIEFLDPANETTFLASLEKLGAIQVLVHSPAGE